MESSLIKDFESYFKNKTPSYIYDLDILYSEIQKIKTAANDFEICYAMKANPILVQFIEPLVDRIEVCSEGEFLICQKLNIPANKIFFTGINKSEESIKAALQYGVTKFNAESMTQFITLLNQKSDILIYPRLSSGNQFGIDDKELAEILKNHNYTKHIAGLHYFCGTFRDKKQRDDLQKLLSFTNQNQINEIEYGPGFGTNYFDKDNYQDSEIRVRQLCDELRIMKPNTKFIIEIGRLLVANCGYYVTKIADIKQNAEMNYIIVDGGINHLNYYGQMLGMKNPSVEHNKSGEAKNYCICGSICSTGDVLVRNIKLENPTIGDLLFFKNTGAYSGTESLFLFLSRSLPYIYSYNKGKFVQLRDKMETYLINIGDQMWKN